MMSDNADWNSDQGLVESQLAGYSLQRLGDYQIHEEIGRGGMGTVYRATHIRLKRTVALKIMTPRLLEDPTALMRFRREIEAVGNLPPHCNVVLATDARQVGRTHFLVMEYVDGCDLGELVRRRGPLPINDTCEIIRQAAAGLDHIAAQGLVHRDLKPSNLLLTHDGVVKILDLGLARFSAFDPVAEKLTQCGQWLGTPDYMAPEQWENSAAVDIGADLYSLGCTMFYLLVGRVPFGEPLHDTLFKKRDAHLRTPPPDLQECRREVPNELAVIYTRLLSKNVSQRITTPRSLAEALKPLASAADLRKLSATAVDRDRTDLQPALAEADTTNDVPSTVTFVPEERSVRDPGTVLSDRRDRRWMRDRRWVIFTFVVAAGLGITLALAIANKDWGPMPTIMSTPSLGATTLQQASLWVRRGEDDASTKSYPLVVEGQTRIGPELTPLTQGDDFHLRVEFSRPTRWLMLWFDTAGRVIVAAQSQQPSAMLHYPGPDSMVSVDPSDPPGEHLLLLVTVDQPDMPSASDLQRALSPLGPPPNETESTNDGTRGPGKIRMTSAWSKQEYLSQVANHLPEGLRVELPLYLPAD